MPGRKRSASIESVGIRVNPQVTFRSRSAAASASSPVLQPNGSPAPTPAPAASPALEETSLTENSPLIPNGRGFFIDEGQVRKQSEDLQRVSMSYTSLLGSHHSSYSQGSCDSELEKVNIDDDDEDVFMKPCTKRDVVKHVKVAVLLMLTLLCSIFLVISKEHEEELHQFSVEPNKLAELEFEASTDYPEVLIKVQGPFLDDVELEEDTAGAYLLRISLDNATFDLYVNTSKLQGGSLVSHEHSFECRGPDRCIATLWCNSTSSVPFLYSYRTLPEDHENDIIYAIIVLVLVYVLIILELVHRTLAALLGSLAAIAVLSAMNERPTLEKIVSWIDMETLSLLFGMMIIVAIFSETGFFDYSARKAYQIAKGKIWPLITLLCLFSAVVSAFLDNVTTILLLAPVTIRILDVLCFTWSVERWKIIKEHLTIYRLCEVLNLDPKQILMAEVLFSNIGGTATAIGDPPNVIIVAATSAQGITFSVFTGHAAIGIVFISFGGYALLRLYYRNIENLKNQEPPEVVELRREIELWRKTASRVVVASREESLVKALIQQKTAELETTLNRTLHKRMREEEKDFLTTYRDLEKKYRITDVPLLIKSGCLLFVVILLLFLHSFIPALHVGLGWIAVLGALWLLVLADIADMETILHKVEWSTLLFFAALFTLMEALGELGLIDGIGDAISSLIQEVGEGWRMFAAVVIILWVSAIASSFIDNIPYTTAMVPVLQKLSENEELNLPLLPLILSLAFGACLGGNGTLIGASANVVCAGIAEQHGYTISFLEFSKVGFPMMLVTVALATIYLIICHVWIGWNT